MKALILLLLVLASCGSKNTTPEPPGVRARWEHIGHWTYRTMTPTGWLVTKEYRLTYIPDPKHEWLAR